MRYDIIIVGAGIGGLITGNLLQKQGHRVLILEKNDYPGGYCTNIKFGDYIFDANIHWICGCEKGGLLYEVLKKFEAENCCEFLKLPFLYRWIDQDNNIDFRASTSLPEYLGSLMKIFPQDEAKIKEFFKLNGNLLDPIIIKRLSEKRVPQIFNSLSSNQQLENILMAPMGFFQWPPENLNALFYMLFSMAHFSQGAYYIKGGAGTFSSALVDIFIKNGGSIEYSLEVSKIKFQKDLIDGVIALDSEGKEREILSKAVVLDINPISLLSKSLKGVNILNNYISTIENRIPSWSAINLYLGLNLDLKESGITDYMIWTPLNRNNSIKDLEMNFEKGNYSKLPLGSITIYSNVDPTCCPKGKSVVSVLCPAKIEPFRKISKNKEDYIKLKQKISEDLLNIVSDIFDISDLRNYVEVMELATPLSFAKYSNDVNGAIMGWQMTTEQFVYNNVAQKTPIKNLFLTGQWASKSGGTPAVFQTAEITSTLVEQYIKSDKV